MESAKILLSDGQEFNLNVPSGAETGIKIFIDPELLIQSGLTSELLLDFDLNNSFVAQGNLSSPSGIKGFNFKPVIRAVNNQLAGSIHGTIEDTEGRLDGVLVTATLDGESATALTDENGYYEILGLKEGLYSVNAYKQGYNLIEKFDINIAANTESEIDFILIKGI